MPTKLTDLEFKEVTGLCVPRRAIKNWKARYYKIERSETPQQFVFKLMNVWNILVEKTDGLDSTRLSSKACSLQEGQNR